MKTFRLPDMVRGWFVGGFAPTAYKTENCEVAVRHYRAGEHEGRHYHKIAHEVTVVVSGRVKMNERIYEAGDIILIEPNDATDFAALEDALTVVVKVPGAPNDKYLGSPTP